jgi:streptogramin lyase
MTTANHSARREKSLPARLTGLAAICRLGLRSLRAPALALAALITVAATSSPAQITAQFTAAQLSLGTSTTLSYPYRVALDSTGNVYISDTQNNRILKETPLPNGSYTETVVASTGLATPYGVAVDSEGNVFIADNGHNRVLEETPSGNIYVETVMPTSALSYPTGVAVDSLDNVYIVDTGHGRVLQEVPGCATFFETVVATGFDQVTGIAVDSSMNLYLSDIDDMEVFKETLSAGTYAQTIVPTTGLNYPYDVAVDASGDLFIADFSNLRIVEEKFFAGSYSQVVYPTANLGGPLGLAVDATGDVYIADTFGQVIWKSSPVGGNFGTVNVGSQSPTGYVIFSFVGTGAPLSLGGLAVTTQGATGLDFTNSGNGDCAAATPYNAGDTCSLGAFIIPQFPAQRLGAAEIYDSSNHVAAVGYLSASGVGPQANFQPGGFFPIAESETLNPQGLAVDASRNVYFADLANDQVLKVTPLGVQTTVADTTNGMVGPESVAVDGAGNIFIADASGNQILKATPSAATYTFDIIANSGFNGLSSPGGVAVDALGNVFVADTDNNRILKETLLSSGQYTQTVIPTTGLAMPFGVTLDNAGNLYIPDFTNNRIVMLTLSAGVYTQSTIVTGLTDPTSVFVDANGNLYIMDYGSGRILKETLSSGTYTQSVIVDAEVAFFGVALDGAGNLYGTDVSGDLVFGLDFADPPSLSFASSNVGTQSSDSPSSETMFNFGNATLSVLVPGSGTNPTFSTGSFTLDGATTCPRIDAVGSLGTLAVNASCIYAIDFSPTTVGLNSDALALTDNTLNNPDAVQSFTVSGTGLGSSEPLATAITLTALPVATSSFGQSVTLTATLAPFAAASLSTNGDSVTFLNGSTSLGTGTLTSGVASLTLTTLPAGVDSLTAHFPGDANFAASTSAALSFTVTKLTPVITWATPLQITFGTALSGTQLNATSVVAGTFVYTPAAGTIPAGGMDTLSVTLTPTDTSTYSNATATVTLPVYDVGLSVTGGAATQTVLQGAPATFPFTAGPQAALTFLNPVTFSVTGLPSGATAVFTPASLPAGSAITPVNLVVQTPAATAAVLREPSAIARLRSAPIGLALLFLPILAMQAFRKRLRLATSTRAPLLLTTVLLATLAVGAAFGISGCTGTTHINSTSYPLVVTATSGSLHTSFNMTLIIDK